MKKLTKEMIISLREKTNQPLNLCRQVLQQTDGDESKAIQLLRQRGTPKAIYVGNNH